MFEPGLGGISFFLVSIFYCDGTSHGGKRLALLYFTKRNKSYGHSTLTSLLPCKHAWRHILQITWCIYLRLECQTLQTADWVPVVKMCTLQLGGCTFQPRSQQLSDGTESSMVSKTKPEFWETSLKLGLFNISQLCIQCMKYSASKSLLRYLSYSF